MTKSLNVDKNRNYVQTIFVPHHKKSGGVLYCILRNFECPAHPVHLSISTLDIPVCSITLFYLRYFHGTSHRCKAPWDNIQNAWTITLGFLVLMLLPFEHWIQPFLHMHTCTCVWSASWKPFGIQETSHTCKASWDDAQNTWIITLGFLLWTYCPLNTENSYFYHVLVSALWVEHHLRYFHKTSQKCKTPWDPVQNTWTITLGFLLFKLLLLNIEYSHFSSCPLCKLTSDSSSSVDKSYETSLM